MPLDFRNSLRNLGIYRFAILGNSACRNAEADHRNQGFPGQGPQV